MTETPCTRITVTRGRLSLTMSLERSYASLLVGQRMRTSGALCPRRRVGGDPGTAHDRGRFARRHLRGRKSAKTRKSDKYNSYARIVHTAHVSRTNAERNRVWSAHVQNVVFRIDSASTTRPPRRHARRSWLLSTRSLGPPRGKTGRRRRGDIKTTTKRVH